MARWGDKQETIIDDDLGTNTDDLPKSSTMAPIQVYMYTEGSSNENNARSTS